MDEYSWSETKGSFSHLLGGKSSYQMKIQCTALDQIKKTSTNMLELKKISL